jgi:type I restriction enzyme S subunit
MPKLPNGWRIEKIGNLCEVGRGSSPRPINDQRYFEGGTIPWIKIADATKSGKYLYETKEHVNEYGASFSRLLPKGSLILAASGTLGYTQLLGVDGCVHDGWLYLTKFNGVEKDFLYYLFLHQKEFFYNSAYGAAIQNINTMILRDMEIALPPLPVQRKIAGVLSAYDDLIEVNMRRIRILEQMAQSVYREWFGKVDEKSLPQGWERVKVADAFEILGGSTPSTKVPEYWEGGNINWYSPNDLTANKAMFIRSSGKKITQKGLKNSSVKIFPSYCVMMTSRATIGVVSINTTDACTNQGFITCIPNDQVSVYQIYFWILDNLELIDNVASGAT